MKKLFAVLMIIVMSFTAHAFSLELSGAVNYSKNIEDGGDEFSRERIRVAHVFDIPKTEDFVGLYGVEYQLKDNENEHAFIPQVGFRYYPLDFITLHIGGSLGGQIETYEGFTMKPVAEVQAGLGRKEILLEAFAGIDDTKDSYAGVRVGYILNF